MTACRHLYYKLIDWFADTPQIARFTGYGLYDRDFVEVLKEIDDIQPFLKAVVAEYGMDNARDKYNVARHWAVAAKQGHRNAAANLAIWCEGRRERS